MTDMTGWEAHGRTSLCQDNPRNCQTCLADFELTQRHAEQLRIDLMQALGALANRSPTDDRGLDGLRDALRGLVPGRHGPCSHETSEAFRSGWNQCVQEIEDRLRTLLVVR